MDVRTSEKSWTRRSASLPWHVKEVVEDAVEVGVDRKHVFVETFFVGHGRQKEGIYGRTKHAGAKVKIGASQPFTGVFDCSQVDGGGAVVYCFQDSGLLS